MAKTWREVFLTPNGAGPVEAGPEPRVVPHARTASFDEKPSTSPEFPRALQSFCVEAVAVST